MIMALEGSIKFEWRRRVTRNDDSDDPCRWQSDFPKYLKTAQVQKHYFDSGELILHSVLNALYTWGAAREFVNLKIRHRCRRTSQLLAYTKPVGLCVQWRCRVVMRQSAKLLFMQGNPLHSILCTLYTYLFIFF